MLDREVGMEDIFTISVEDIQHLAKSYMGRELVHDELVRVKKGLNTGLESWEYVATVAIDELIKENSKAIQ
jgi:hypothetical protein